MSFPIWPQSEALDHWGQPTPSAGRPAVPPQTPDVLLASAASFPWQAADSLLYASFCEITLLLSSRAISTVTLAFRCPVTGTLPLFPHPYPVMPNRARPKKQNLFLLYLQILIVIYTFTQYSSNRIEDLLWTDIVKY